MTHDTGPAYGLWGLAIINTAVFVIFAFSFTKPTTSRDWRSFGAFSAFIVALFTEMYGFPLTIYLLSGWISRTYPGIDPFSHDAGHLWSTLLGLHGDPHWSVLHLLSMAAIFGGSSCYQPRGRFSMTRSAGTVWPRPVSMNMSGTRNTSDLSSSWSVSCCSGRRS
jgi:hypothetical protein